MENDSLMSSLTEKIAIALLKNGYLPRGMVILIDSLILLITYLFSVVILNDGKLSILKDIDIWRKSVLILSFYNIAFQVFKSYSGAFRFTAMRDLVFLSYSGILGGVLSYTVPILFGILKITEFPTFDIISLLLTTNNFILAVSGIRLIVKLAYSRFIISSKSAYTKKILIYGANNFSVALKNAIAQDKEDNKLVIGYIDNNPRVQGKSIEGIPILTIDFISNTNFLKENYVTEIIWSLEENDSNNFQVLGELCLQQNIRFTKIPAIGKWINNENSLRAIQPVKIEELLDRTVIKLDNNKLEDFFYSQVVLITGAAGSIGSELSRQLLFYKPSKIILLDNSETPLNELILEFDKLSKNKNRIIPIIADVTREDTIQQIFQKHLPTIVFHAAAYKHVPLMELNPSEAIRINLVGTQIVALAAIQVNTKKFVFISSDKAVNPTNVMGATKRAAELYLQQLHGTCKTEFIATRFGNVLGSNGSVIPIFKKQIENRENITITHKDIIRYFMTIPEACQLVFEGASMGKGGEIFAFDMGKPVKIYDLAVKMIKLSGLTLDRDIKIIETGLRPGEKLYEELLGDTENTLPTHHPKITISKDTYKVDSLAYLFDQLILLLNTKTDNINLVRELKKIVPEYKSQNSIYETLDKLD